MSVARKIVANLAWRYRLAARERVLYEGRYTNPNNTTLMVILHAKEVEAWNAYQVSKRILLGGQP